MADLVSAAAHKKSLNVAPELQEKIGEQARQGRDALDAAAVLRYQASLAGDDGEREELLAQAEAKDREAESHDKAARRMASGAWQGTAAGAGIGAGVGGGLGALVGTLVGAVASVPTTGLGALVGLPVGLIHGPFVKTDLNPQDAGTEISNKASEEEGTRDRDKTDSSDEQSSTPVIDPAEAR